MDWALWFYWIMATTIGWLIGNFLFSGIPLIIAGAIISALQWATLYQRIHKASRWFIYSSAGWIIGYTFFVLLSANNIPVPSGPVVGLGVGIAQWIVLRKEINWAGWWIIISIMAWTTGLNLIPGLLTSGALPGAITGFTLIILLRFSISQKKKKKDYGSNTLV